MATTIQILSASAAKQFDIPPKLRWTDRRRILNVSPDIQKVIDQIRQPNNRAAFMLQYLYFRASGRFYAVESFHAVDIRVVARIYSLSTIDFSAYHKVVNSRHREQICELAGFQRMNSQLRQKLKIKADELCRIQQRPRLIIAALSDYLLEQKVEGVGYHALATVITTSFNLFKADTVKQLSAFLTEELRGDLDSLVAIPEDGSTASLVDLSRFIHSQQNKSIKENCRKLSEIQRLHKQLFSAQKALALAPEVVDYYARTALSFQPFQLTRRNEDRFLYLFCAVVHLNRTFQDSLVEIFLASCRKSEKEVTELTQAAVAEELAVQRAAVKVLVKTAESSQKTLAKIETAVEETATDPVEFLERILTIMRERRSEEPLNDTELPEFSSKGKDDFIEETSPDLSTKISVLLTLIQFDSKHSNTHLCEAISYFTTHEHLGKKSPTGFLTEKQKTHLYDSKGKLRQSLYKGYLYFATALAIRSGTLNLLESYKFRAFETYLIPSDRWQSQKSELLTKHAMNWAKSASPILELLREELHAQNEITQKNILNKTNLYARTDPQGRVGVKTPAVDSADEIPLSELMPVQGSVPLFQILSGIEKLSSFTGSMDHLYQKSVKKRPAKSAILAAIIGYGCNLGVERMAKMVRNVSSEEVSFAAKWLLSVENLHSANTSILSLTEQLRLSAVYYRNPGKRHTSSDGQKFTVGIDSIDASYSHKYFGTQKGISVYSFIDEAHKLPYSTVITPSEREAAYVIDGLMANDVVQSDIHSTDTHGYSEVIFAVCHLLGVSFAPRIKNLKYQRYYSFEMPSEANKEGYKILSSGRIKSELIEDQWDEILRLIVTIKSKEETASQLFKRLSSYSRQHPLYRALKQFGRIVKSVFLLRYIDDVELRQAIEKQLNKVESYHQFAKAVFFGGNQEFNYATREEQLVAEGCKRLIANAIICWNYLYLSKQISAAETPDAKRIIVRAVVAGSVVTWQHVNFHGEYDVSEKLLKGGEVFNLEELLDLDFDWYFTENAT